MKRHYTIILLLAILAISCSDMQPQDSKRESDKGTLFIIGGGTRPDKLVNRMIDEAGVRDQGYVVVLPMASSLPDSAIIWSSEQFVRNGIENIAAFNFTADADPNPQWVDSLQKASLIYISGGDQNKFMQIIAGTPIESAIREAYASGAMIAGTSAGAAVMSELMITGNELRYPEYSSTFRTIEAENLELASGLGFLTTAIVDQHFVWRSRHNRLLTAVIEHPELIGIGIDESTAILVKGNQAEVVGESQVLVFQNPDKSYREANAKLGAKNIKIDLYLPGEKFSLN